MELNAIQWTLVFMFSSPWHYFGVVFLLLLFKNSVSNFIISNATGIWNWIKGLRFKKELN